MDMDTGHVLWLYHGKSKASVYKFIEHVGMEWMKGVQCVASDMNADFLSAFKQKCPWIKGVYYSFHLIKTFNEKVISEVRKDEKRRLSNDKEHAIFAAAPKKKTYTVMKATYQQIIKDNKLLIGLDFVKNSLSDAYTTAISFENMCGHIRRYLIIEKRQKTSILHGFPTCWRTIWKVYVIMPSFI